MKFFFTKPFKNYFLVIFFLFILLIGGGHFYKNAYSDELDDLNKQIADLQSALTSSQNATKPLKSELDNLKKQLDNIDYQVNVIEKDIAKRKIEIDKGYEDLSENQKIFNSTVRSSYISSYGFTPLIIFLSGEDAGNVTKLLTYHERYTKRDKEIITNVALQIVGLEEKKAKLESQQIKLASAKQTLDKQRGEVQKVVDGAVAYQNTLSGQIAALTAKQQEILSQRLGALNIPLYASAGGACSSDIGKDPGFGGSKFGFFTYGVPNRVGLNQYGAFGRAKAGQNYETILGAYYNYDSIESKSATINVEGYGSYSLDDYVKRIYEVPESWGDQGGMEALKAQAIAARSYALAYTNNGAGSICTTQSCQVFKPDPKGGNWEQAVNDTSGKVMVKGGNAIKAWFSSTHGGYIHNSGDIGWSSTDWTKNAQDASGNISSFSDLNNNAYDKDSPWFYCDWGSRSEYNGTAWLKPEEVADIVNVILLAQKDSSTVKHLYQVDKPNPEGTDTWDANRVRQELGSSAYTSIDNVSISADFSYGKTTGVTVSGNGKSNSFSSDTFVTYFDLRAPATIYIPQLGKNGDGTLKSPLFNVER